MKDTKLRYVIREKVKRLIKEEKFEYESVEESGADPQPEVKEAIERFREMDPEERDTNVLLCPADRCEYETDSKVGLAVHWGKSSDETHPGKLKDKHGVDTSRPDAFSDKLSSSQKKRWKKTSKKRKDEIMEKVARKQRGKSLSDEHKEKLSKALSGENNPMYGKSLSEEHKQKISESLSGENHPFYGCSHTEEAKRKMSESSKGISPSEEARQKMKGISPSEEARQKIADSVSEYWNSLSENKKEEINEKRSKSISDAWNSKSEEELKEWKENISKGIIKAGAGGCDYNTYKVDDLDHVVRSKWEKEVAYMLQDLEIEYEYEPVYKLENKKIHKPDFKTYNNVIIEVKGFADDKSIQKAKKFINLYENKRYIVVGDKMPSHSRVEYKNVESEQIKKFLAEQIL